MNDNIIENIKNISKPFKYGLADPKIIAELEELLGKDIPSDFKKILIEWGGYEMALSYEGDFSFIFNFQEEKGGRVLITFSHSLPIKVILRRCESWNISIPDKAIYFEECGDGSVIFMSMTDGSEGEIYYMERDHYLHFPEFDDYEDEDAAVEAFDPANGIVPNIFTKLGNSFDDFVTNIEILEEVENGKLIPIKSPFN